MRDDRVGKKAWSVAIAIVVGLSASGCNANDGAAPPKTGCELPSTGGGRVRLVNATTSGTATDFCIRASGTSDWGAPVLGSGGDDGLCGSGLAYAQLTIPFAVEAGSIDVKAIAASRPCSAVATSEKDGVAVGAAASGAPVVTLLRVGASGAEEIVALAEEASLRPNVTDLRVVNALAATTSINAGLASSPTLPATVTSTLPTPIAHASVEPPGSSSFGTIDAAGYVGLLPVPLSFGVVLSNEADAVFVIATPTTPARQTLYVIGAANDPAHPIRGLYCEDATIASAGADGGASASLLASCAP